MVSYSYTSDAGETIEESFAMAEAPVTVSVDGTVYRKDCVADMRPRRLERRNVKIWPKLDDSLGVLPSQAKEAAAHLHEVGVPTAFTDDGRCEVRSSSHRKRIHEALNFFDKDAGYSDRTKS